MSEPELPLLVGAHIEERGLRLGEAPCLVQHGRRWSWREYRDACVRSAHLLRARLGRVDDARPGHVAMLLDNHFELLAVYGGCAYAGLTLFGVNTGLRGDTLAGVLEQSKARVLVTDAAHVEEVRRVQDRLGAIAPENVLVVGGAGCGEAAADWDARLADEAGGAGALEPPDGKVEPERPLMVIYTSGTTGLPKGILNNHLKFCFIGKAIKANLGLEGDSVGYACMPLFHSNALFLGFQPILEVGGTLAMRERFSASRFVPDVLEHGVTYWNYVGEPVHYVLSALERQYDGDEERILAEVARNPKNRLRYALGNGASPPDIDRFERWLGLEDMFELYGSTEAAISTFRRRGDPRGSVGEITDENVKILDEKGSPCPPAEIGPDGKIRNYEAAVGEICRVAPDTALFQGYFENPDANRSKYRDGVYHSGDLGYVQERDGKRFLFFAGRTDDWIRKDGENFSAAQVGRLLQEHPDVSLAAASGVPCAVSDELVMAALKLRPGSSFDPEGFYAFCDEQVEKGGMDRKWVPDFVRVVEDFTFTQTQKILVRELKRDHFHRGRLPDAPIYWRERGDRSFKPFTADDFETLRKDFRRAEREAMLER